LPDVILAGGRDWQKSDVIRHKMKHGGQGDFGYTTTMVTEEWRMSELYEIRTAK
jgi:hypothetical protein